MSTVCYSGEGIRIKFLFVRFSCFGLLGRVLEPVPAAYGRRQGTSLNGSPAHPGPYVSIWGMVPCSRAPGQFSEGVLAPLSATRTPSIFLSLLGLEPRTLQPSAQPPTGWAPTTLDGKVYNKFKRKKSSCHQYLCKRPAMLTICDHSITVDLPPSVQQMRHQRTSWACWWSNPPSCP